VPSRAPSNFVNGFGCVLLKTNSLCEAGNQVSWAHRAVALSPACVLISSYTKHFGAGAESLAALRHHETLESR
jgi:hypothetical protein